MTFIQFGNNQQCHDNGVGYGTVYNFGTKVKQIHPSDMSRYKCRASNNGYTCAPQFGTTFILTLIY